MCTNSVRLDIVLRRLHRGETRWVTVHVTSPLVTGSIGKNRCSIQHKSDKKRDCIHDVTFRPFLTWSTAIHP